MNLSSAGKNVPILTKGFYSGVSFLHWVLIRIVRYKCIIIIMVYLIFSREGATRISEQPNLVAAKHNRLTHRLLK